MPQDKKAERHWDSYTLTDRVFHCALDDTIDVMEEIAQKADTLTSVFDVPVMALLKSLHDRYGATFTLYLFYEKLDGFNLTQMPDKFIDQWHANSHWLRLSFHSRTKKPGVVDYYLYNTKDYKTAFDDFCIIKQEILRFAGAETWDNYPRTHFWSGNRDTVRAWKDCGVDGMFYSYPGYAALYFDEDQLKDLWARDFWYDSSTDMLFITTNIKLPCMTVDQVKQDLASLHDHRIVEIFADDYNVIELKEHMETAIAWAVDHGFKPVFYDEVFD